MFPSHDRRAGKYANTTIIASGAALGEWCDEAEAVINDTARVDLVTNYDNLTANGKKICQNIASCFVAQGIVTYSPIDYLSQGSAELMLDYLENQIRRNLKLLEEDKVKAYLKAT